MACGIVSVVAFAAIGGVLFGLDQGNWGGAIVKEGFVEAFCKGSYQDCHDAAGLPAEYAQFLSLGSSLLQLGAACGGLFVAPWCARSLGRQEAMFIGSLLTICGCLPQALTTEVAYFLSARFAAGVGVGVVTYALPMFISEIAPAELRGALGCSMQLTCVLGTVIASVLNCQSWFTYDKSFAMPALPAAVVAAGIFFFPKSPRFLLMKGQRDGLPDGGVEEAWKALRQLRKSDEATDEELEHIRESLATEACEEAPWSSLWLDPSIRRRVLIAIMLQWLQQFTGINAILSYGPAIFQSAGVPLTGLTCAALTNCFNFLGTMIMMSVIDHWGRRLLLLIGAVSMLLSLSLATVLSYILEEADDGSATFFGWCLLVCMCAYMLSFAIAWGGVPWVYPSEIFPMSIKEKALSSSVCSQWTANFVIAYLIPQQVELMKVTGTFCFYSICLAFNFLLVYALVPETSGVPLEEMGALFGKTRRAPSSLQDPLVATETPSLLTRTASSSALSAKFPVQVA